MMEKEEDIAQRYFKGIREDSDELYQKMVEFRHWMHENAEGKL